MVRRANVLLRVAVASISLVMAGFAPAALAWPEKGKTINVIVNFAAGGGTANSAQMMAALLEKDLQTPVQVLFRPGAGQQVGATELVRAKPDGYTIGYMNTPGIHMIYLDPQRRAVFTAKSFRHIATHFASKVLIAVRADSPFKTLDDLTKAAKARPGKVTVATSGFMGVPHLSGVLLEKAAGVKFAFVHFDGGDTPAIAGLLGGHVQVNFTGVAGLMPHIKSGDIRPLANFHRNKSDFLPDVKSVRDLGYSVDTGTIVGIVAPAGTPTEVVTVLDKAIKKAHGDESHRQKITQSGFEMFYLGPEDYAKYWADTEDSIRPILQEVLKK